ncbi:5,10-methylenetetrahydrofolate reductase [Pieris napi]|uniref:5,10-methylenetetrahydrofolate reductase n=1 Tax=Pieris napi TaxID=78633 RepID=UPI001FBB80A7|nr:5,10-methylenetetrahydrofolate reductase [Pieris napi]
MARKITDILNNIDKFSYSFEVTPNVTEEELNNIKLEPAFYAITWHAKLYDFNNLDIQPLKLAETLASKNKNVLLNLSCHKLRKEYLYRVLDFLKSKGICNLFIVQGEGYDENLSDFKSTSDLVASIQDYTGNYFSIGVAGHCEKLVSIESLKEKISRGADFIITQAFFDPNVFKLFIVNCKDAGITTPIIPGVFPFDNQDEVEKFISLCKINIDAKIMDDIKNLPSEEVVKNLVNLIYNETHVKHFHFFTMNKFEKTSKIIKGLVPL